MFYQYERGNSPFRKFSDLALGQWRILSTAFLLVKNNILTINKNYTQEDSTITNKNNGYNKNNSDNYGNEYEDSNKTMYKKHVKDKLLNKSSYELSNNENN